MKKLMSKVLYEIKEFLKYCLEENHLYIKKNDVTGKYEETYSRLDADITIKDYYKKDEDF